MNWSMVAVHMENFQCTA